MEKFPFTIDLVSTALLHLYRKIDWGAFSKSFKSPESRKDCKKEINSSINLTRKINKKKTRESMKRYFVTKIVLTYCEKKLLQ